MLICPMMSYRNDKDCPVQCVYEHCAWHDYITGNCRIADIANNLNRTEKEKEDE